MPRNEDIERLHTTYNSLCPNETSQKALAKAREEAAKISEKEVLICITGAIYDGLVHGNWTGV